MTKTSPNQVRDSIIARKANFAPIQAQTTSKTETFLNAAHLRDAHQRLQRETLSFKLDANFEKFSHNIQQLEKGKSHGHLNA